MLLRPANGLGAGREDPLEVEELWAAVGVEMEDSGFGTDHECDPWPAAIWGAEDAAAFPAWRCAWAATACTASCCWAKLEWWVVDDVWEFTTTRRWAAAKACADVGVPCPP